METVKTLIEHLKQYANQDAPIAYALWGVEDVIDRAKDMDKDIILTKDEVSKAVHDIHNNHDCEYGITWDSVDCAIDDILSRRN